MAFCPTDCADDKLLPANANSCDLATRKKGVYRFGIFNCGTALPDPFDCTALQALVDADALVFTSPVANAIIEDPVYEDIVIADCIPTKQIAVSRTITFEDRIAVTKSATESPQGAKVNFYDYDFWQDKLDHTYTTRYMIQYCDGSVVVPKDENGNPLEASLTSFLASEQQGTGIDSFFLEIKKQTLRFKGDPLAYTNKPEIDGSNEVFNMEDCSF